MTIEAATYVNQLEPLYPEGSSTVAQGDDAIRLVKACLLQSFPGIGGALALSHTQLNALARAILTADGTGLIVPAVASRAGKVFAFTGSGGVDVSLAFSDLQNAIYIALGGANFKGEWSTLTGPLLKPASVFHQGAFWMLLSDLPDVTTSVPGVSPAWVNLIYGGTVTSISAAGTTTLTPANAGLVLVNATAGNIAINLPAASAQVGLPIQFIRIDSTPGNSVTINRAGTDTIDGSVATSFRLVGQFDRRDIKSNGIATWYTVAANYASACSVYQSIAQTSISGATFTKVNLQTKTTDGGGEFDATSSYRFTAKQAGLYQINGGINVSAPAAGNGYFCAIYQNGSMVARGSSVVGYGGAVQSCSSVSTTIQLNLGDFIELYAYGDIGFSLVTGPSATRLSISRLQ